MQIFREKVMGNIMVRPFLLEKKGDRVPPHTHPFHHVTDIDTGSALVNKKRRAFRESGEPWLDEEGKQVWVLVARKEFIAGQYFLVLAEELHEIIALEDNTQGKCLYSHRTPQGLITQEFTGWEKSYASGDPIEESPLGPGTTVPDDWDPTSPDVFNPTC